MVDGECIARGARHCLFRGSDAGIPVRVRPVDRADPCSVDAPGRTPFHVQPSAGTRVTQLGTGEGGEGSIRGTALARVPYDKGYAEPLAAVREAVDAQSRKRGGSDGSPAMYAWVPSLLAAIDALKEDR